MRYKENNRLRDDVRYETLTFTFKCEQCGKKFIAYCNRGDYAYKRDNKYVFCKWSCMRAWDKAHIKSSTTHGYKRKNKEAAAV